MLHRSHPLFGLDIWNTNISKPMLLHIFSYIVHNQLHTQYTRSLKQPGCTIERDLALLLTRLSKIVREVSSNFDISNNKILHDWTWVLVWYLLSILFYYRYSHWKYTALTQCRPYQLSRTAFYQPLKIRMRSTDHDRDDGSYLSMKR